MTRAAPKVPVEPWWADPDPWRLSPEQQAEADDRKAWRDAQREASPDEPPF